MVFKRLGLVALSAVLLTGSWAWANPKAGDPCVLNKGKEITFGTKKLGSTASPHVIDWNEDGKFDLLVGTMSHGAVYLFINEGTNEKPVFPNAQRVISNNVPIGVASW